MHDEKIALFILLGQSLDSILSSEPYIIHTEPLHLSPSYDLSESIPDIVREASSAAQAYKLLFIFEDYLREFVYEVLSKKGAEGWWEKIPKDIQEELDKTEDTESTKKWMALTPREKYALMTYPQLIKIIEHRWKEDFSDLVRDRTLMNEAKSIAHLRNTICHMTTISEEELHRIKQVMRDWFRMISP